MRPATEAPVTEAHRDPRPWLDREPWRVAAARPESHDTVTLELEPPPGRAYSFRPGQFNMLYVFGIGEVPISVSGDPAADGPVRHTIRDVGAVTHALCTRQPGQEVGVRGPYGTHWPLAEAEGGDMLVVAGGVGLPPLRPALYHLLAHRDHYRRVTLLYGARTPADLLFPEELAGWRSRFDLEVEVTETWDQARDVYLVDAVASGGQPGNIYRFDVTAEPLAPRLSPHGTHALGVADIIELARALGRLPHRLVSYGIEGSCFSAGASLSPPVRDAVAVVSERLLTELTPGAPPAMAG